MWMSYWPTTTWWTSPFFLQPQMKQVLWAGIVGGARPLKAGLDVQLRLSAGCSRYLLETPPTLEPGKTAGPARCRAWGWILWVSPRFICASELVPCQIYCGFLSRTSNPNLIYQMNTFLNIIILLGSLDHLYRSYTTEYYDYLVGLRVIIFNSLILKGTSILICSIAHLWQS